MTPAVFSFDTVFIPSILLQLLSLVGKITTAFNLSNAPNVIFT